MNKNKILSGGREKSDRGREVGLEGEGIWGGRGAGKWGERGREVGIGYFPVHPLPSARMASRRIAIDGLTNTLVVQSVCDNNMDWNPLRWLIYS